MNTALARLKAVGPPPAGSLCTQVDGEALNSVAFDDLGTAPDSHERLQHVDSLNLEPNSSVRGFSRAAYACKATEA